MGSKLSSPKSLLVYVVGYNNYVHETQDDVGAWGSWAISIVMAELVELINVVVKPGISLR